MIVPKSFRNRVGSRFEQVPCLEPWWLLTIIGQRDTEDSMNGLIYLVGLVVVILAVLSFFGLR